MSERNETIAATLAAGMLASHAAGRWTGKLESDVKYAVRLYRLFVREVEATKPVPEELLG